MPDEIKEEPKEETPKEETTEPAKEEPKVEKQETPEEQVDWEKRYKDLQTTYNKRDKEVSTLKSDSENYQKLKTFIEGDAETYEFISKKLTQPSKPSDNGQATDSTRKTLGQTIIRDFEERYGLSGLDQEKANNIRKSITSELADKYSPENRESHILDFVPIEKLENDLEKAYRYATLDDVDERARLKALAEARQNREGTLGSLPSSSGSGNQTPLTPEQREAAKNTKVSEEAYAKQLQAIAKGE